MDKRLWKDSRYDEPLRNFNEFPEDISNRYPKWVKKHKYSAPPDNSSSATGEPN
jgi:hypothetical protein